MIIKKYDKCGKTFEKTVLGSAITSRPQTPIGELDLCPECREVLKDMIWKWVNEG